MVIRFKSRNFRKYVASDVAGRIVGKVANGGESVSPKVLESLTSVERISVVFAIELLVIEAKVKQTRMIVRAIVIIAILAALVITDAPFWEVLAKALHEFLMVGLD